MSELKGTVISISPELGEGGRPAIWLSREDSGRKTLVKGQTDGLAPGMLVSFRGAWVKSGTSLAFRCSSWMQRKKTQEAEDSLFSDMDMEDYPNEFRCTVERIIYHHEQTSFMILSARPDSKSDKVTLKGTMPGVQPGLRLSVKGEWKDDPKYGIGFICEQFEIVMPTEGEGIVKYLASGAIEGIGKITAQKIVDYFGERTLEILDADIEQIKDVPGIPSSRKQKIIDGWNSERQKRDLIVFLGKNGLPLSLAEKIFSRYGSGSFLTIRSNPYILADEISGIGFKTADIIAQGLDIKKDNPYRIKSGIRYSMKEIVLDGNTYTTKEELAQKAAKHLDLDTGIIEDTIESMTSSVIMLDNVDIDLIDDGGHLYLKAYYRAELKSAEMLNKILKAGPSKTITKAIDFSELEKKASITYDENQRDAIITAATSKIAVITGGPGTGKTTITNGLIKVFKDADFRILLAAPTGRAAKRMSEATKFPAGTIHRLLEADASGFAKNQDNQLEGDVLIVDESSMIDINLLYALLKAVPLGMRIIFVGDVDQLPSVGPGNVLRDIISSEVIPTVRLKRIFRQGSDSSIITNAHLINAGMMPELSREGSDFVFIEKNSQEEIQDTIVELVTETLPKEFNIYPNEIQVLSPMRRSIIGVVDLNNILQQKINPGKVCHTRENYELRVGDKVMQTKNDRDKGVYNGDMGIIKMFKESDQKQYSKVVIQFDDREVDYAMDSLDDIELAYAATVHKSQGSEYPIVVIPVSMSHSIMLRRNLLYTGVTRAKKLCILVGERNAVATMVHNADTGLRRTRLKDMIQKAFSL